MSALIPIAEDVWGIESSASPGPGMRMPVRATVLRLGSGDLVLHSPVALDDGIARELAALGPVKHIVAPNVLHWMSVRAAAERYPAARVLGAGGLEDKLTAKAGVRFETLAPGVFGDEIVVGRIDGAPSLNEHVFLHARSRSLVVSDLVFNIRSGASVPMSIVLWINGAHQKTAQSRVWKLAVKDRAAAAATAAEILAWDYERVVVAHGDVVADDAPARMREALAWMVKAPGAPPERAPAA